MLKQPSSRVAHELAGDVNPRLAMLMVRLGELKHEYPGAPLGLKLWLEYAAREAEDLLNDIEVHSQSLQSSVFMECGTARHTCKQNEKSRSPVDIAEAFVKRTEQLYFLINTCCDLAFTNADLVQQAKQLEKKNRFRRYAFSAYETALRLKMKISLPADRQSELDARLRMLEAKLRALGSVESSFTGKLRQTTDRAERAQNPAKD